MITKECSECGADFKTYKTTQVTCSRSCGAASRNRRYPNPNLRHRGAGTLLYRRWSSMRARCGNPHATAFHRYGGRGLRVCDEWQNSFIVFRDWAIANGYNPRLQLDRINNDLGYSPTNVHFVPAKINANNRSTNHRLPWGETISDYARRIGVNHVTLRSRLNRGTPPEDLTSKPIIPRRNKNKLKNPCSTSAPRLLNKL